jgi:hypothetical protein
MNKQLSSWLGWYFFIPLCWTIHFLQDVVCFALEFLDDAEEGVHETMREMGWQVEEID